MFSRYTESAQRAIVLAQEEARRLGFDYVGTEHLLLGLIAEEQGAAGKLLRHRGFTPERLRDDVRKATGGGPGAGAGREIGFTPRAKRVMVQLAVEEARALNHRYVGTEHLLLGLLQEGGLGAQILQAAGLTYEQAWTDLLHLLGTLPPPTRGATRAERPEPATDSPRSARGRRAEERQGFPFIDGAHAMRYQEAVSAYMKQVRRSPDRRWTALLFLTTTTRPLWDAVSAHIAYETGKPEVAPEVGARLETDDRALLEAALALSTGSPVVLPALIDSLEPPLLELVLEAARFYRARRREPAE